MGLRFLNGLSWAEVTREERFFCQRLYEYVRLDPGKFIDYLNQICNLTLPVITNWEAAIEVCFYRDLWQHRGRNEALYSPKRTFDICVFSDEAILIIEAKANQDFKYDQVQSFKNDPAEVRRQTGIDTIILLGLASSKCQVPASVREVFQGVATWKELARFYNNDPVLLRADDIYFAQANTAWGYNNSSGYMTGIELLNAYGRGEEFMVGRGGGLFGNQLRHDLESGNWKYQKYESDRNSESPKNRNWFRLSEFMKLLPPS